MVRAVTQASRCMMYRGLVAAGRLISQLASSVPAVPANKCMGPNKSPAWPTVIWYERTRKVGIHHISPQLHKVATEPPINRWKALLWWPDVGQRGEEGGWSGFLG